MVFVDANVIVYAATAADEALASACKSIIRAIGEGQIEARTSVAVIEEVWHLELRERPGGLQGATASAYALFTPLLPVTDDEVRSALRLVAPALGANDRIHAATCVAHRIHTIVSADAGFDQVAETDRLDPADSAAVAVLLG